MEEQKPKLTKREEEILALLAEGLSSQEVANKLYISRRTVEFHIQSLYQKFPHTRGSRIKLITTLERSFGKI